MPFDPGRFPSNRQPCEGYLSLSLETIEETLDMTGRLLGATKLMDMYLKDGLDIQLMIDDFMNGRYDFRTAVDKGVALKTN